MTALEMNMLPTAPSQPSDATPESSSTPVEGTPRVLLRLEGALVLALATAAYFHTGGTWGWFVGLFLLPDISLLGYLVGPRIGAHTYNLGHSYLGPAVLAVSSLLGAPSVALLGALIWTAHIGFDRMLGYGLKYETSFGHTHLGVVGKLAGK